jgi:putative ABC transport system substrate-binding protein
MNRRDFITLLCGAVAAWPLAARAQQRALPLIGYISGRTANSDASMLVSFRRGLGDVGYSESRNVAIEYRFADGQYDRLSTQLTDLTQRKVGVIVFPGVVPTEELVQQVRASPIPIVMSYGGDPVRLGLVASINRPGGNVTGVIGLSGELSGKRLGLLHDLVPKAATIAALTEDSDPAPLRGARDAAAALGQKLLVLEAGAICQARSGTGGRDARRREPIFSHSGGADCGARGTPSHPRNLYPAGVCRSRWPHELWV